MTIFLPAILCQEKWIASELESPFLRDPKDLSIFGLQKSTPHINHHPMDVATDGHQKHMATDGHQRVCESSASLRSFTWPQKGSTCAKVVSRLWPLGSAACGEAKMMVNSSALAHRRETGATRVQTGWDETSKRHRKGGCKMV